MATNCKDAQHKATKAKPMKEISIKEPSMEKVSIKEPSVEDTQHEATEAMEKVSIDKLSMEDAQHEATIVTEKVSIDEPSEHSIKDDLKALKNEIIKTIKDENKIIKDELETIKAELKSIKDHKSVKVVKEHKAIKVIEEHPAAKYYDKVVGEIFTGRCIGVFSRGDEDARNWLKIKIDAMSKKMEACLSEIAIKFEHRIWKGFLNGVLYVADSEDIKSIKKPSKFKITQWDTCGSFGPNSKGWKEGHKYTNEKGFFFVLEPLKAQE